MVDRLAAHHCLAVTGISGSGKSSLARTGLLDALERGLLAEAGTEWCIADFRPGNHPLTALASALIEEISTDKSGASRALAAAKLARGPLGLMEWLDEIAFPTDTNLLLLVDQFEEIFRFSQGEDRDEIEDFMALLLTSARQRTRPVYIVITMRSDFLGDCAQFAELAETINDGQFLTPRLTREQCRRAIEEPAASAAARSKARWSRACSTISAAIPTSFHYCSMCSCSYGGRRASAAARRCWRSPTTNVSAASAESALQVQEPPGSPARMARCPTMPIGCGKRLRPSRSVSPRPCSGRSSTARG
jgi:hypothetical protein